MQLLPSVAGIITSGLSSNSGSIPLRLVRPYRTESVLTAGAADAGVTAVTLMQQRFPYRTAAWWQERADVGALRVEGRPDGSIVKAGDRIVHVREEVIEPGVPDLALCLHDGGSWSAWFKPAPMPVHAGGRYLLNTLAAIVEAQLQRPFFPVHRLDAVTSGVMLAAHTKTAAATLSAAFRDPETIKTYLAIVSGAPNQQHWTVTAPIRRKKGFVFELHADGMDAETRFECLERTEGFALVRCRPITGRTHQIRLHLQDSGVPVWDDPVYGSVRNSALSHVRQDTAISLLHTALTLPAADISVALPGFGSS